MSHRILRIKENGQAAQEAEGGQMTEICLS